jgi:hypothetical protein
VKTARPGLMPVAGIRGDQALRVLVCKLNLRVYAHLAVALGTAPK